MKKSILLIGIIVSVSFGELLQSGNWRQPYFLIAKDLGAAEKTSGSDMFHDGIGNVSLFNNALWPDSVKMSSNHWLLEPAVTTGAFSDHDDGQDPWLFKLGLLNSIVYKNILVRQTLHVDKMYEYDNAYPAHQDRAMRGRIEESFLQVNWKYGMFRLGRTERNWGPFADRSLFLSSNPYTYDALEWQVQSKVFEFRHLFTAFPYERSQWDTDGRQINRFFSAHALNIIAGKWLTAGVFESVVFVREKGFPDLSYVNPFSIYTVINTNQEGVGNLMLGVQWDIKPFTDNVSFKGQIAWDDFQVDDESVTDQEPTHWGMDMGVYWKNPLPVNLAHSFKLEYNLQSEWLYTVPDNNMATGERYTYLTKSLGFEDNDGYEINGAFTFAGKNYWAASVNAGYEARGGNSPLSRWNDLTHTPGLPYDSLNVPTEKTVSFGLTAHGYFRDYVNVAVTFTNAWIKNENNVSTDEYEYSPQIKAELSVHYSDLIIKLPD